MGNPDLIIVINGKAFQVLSNEYTDREEAITLAMKLHTKYIDNANRDIEETFKDFSSDELIDNIIQYDINKIEVYELEG